MQANRSKTRLQKTRMPIQRKLKRKQFQGGWLRCLIRRSGYGVEPVRRWLQVTGISPIGGLLVAMTMTIDQYQDVVVCLNEEMTRREGVSEKMDERQIMDNLIDKKPFILGDKDAVELLHDICEREHSSCNCECPIYDEVLTREQKKDSSCPYFRNGTKMLKALRQKRGGE